MRDPGNEVGPIVAYSNLCVMPANKINKLVHQFGYQWRALFAGQAINKHINMGKFGFNLNVKL